MSDYWKTILEHLPLIHVAGATAGQQKMIDAKDLIGAIIIGALSAKGGAMLTTNEIALKLDAMEKQQTTFAAKTEAYVEQARSAQMMMVERLGRLEERQAAMSSMSGMNGMGGDRRPR